MGQKSSVITLEVLTLIKHVHRVVLACFHVGAYQSFFGWKNYSPPIPPHFWKSPDFGGEAPPWIFSAYWTLQALVSVSCLLPLSTCLNSILACVLILSALLSAFVQQLLCTCFMCSDMEYSVVKWNKLCLDMGRFEEDFYERFVCDPGSLTAEKIKSNTSEGAFCRK